MFFDVSLGAKPRDELFDGPLTALTPQPMTNGSFCILEAAGQRSPSTGELQDVKTAIGFDEGIMDASNRLKRKRRIGHSFGDIRFAFLTLGGA